MKYDAGWQSFSGQIENFEFVAHKNYGEGSRDRLEIEDTSTGLQVMTEMLPLKTVEVGEVSRVEMTTSTHKALVVCYTK
jgi:hypothetical protein